MQSESTGRYVFRSTFWYICLRCVCGGGGGGVGVGVCMWEGVCGGVWVCVGVCGRV